MAITFDSLLKVARRANALGELRSVVFDGKSAMTANEMSWVVGVPCVQPNITKPVVVPAAAIMAHMAKSRHLVVMPDHLSNGQGLTTPFDKPKKWDDSVVLGMLPARPKSEAVVFDLELDALDRVLVAAGEHDIRYYLNGVLFDLSNGVLVGTNGHRMHLYRNRVPVVYPMQEADGSCRAGGAVQVILPRDPLKWMLHSAGRVAQVAVFNPLSDKVNDLPALPGVLLQADDTFVWVRKPLEGRYVDYERVTPAVLTRPVWAALNPVQFADVLGAVGKVARMKCKKFPAVVIDFGAGQVMVDADRGQVMPFEVLLHSDDDAIDLAGLRGDLLMGIEPGYVQDLADCVTPAAQWRFGHQNVQNSSLSVVDGDFSGVVMPLRMSGPVKVAQVVPVVEAVPVAFVAPEPVGVPDAQEDPQDMPPEPCPAAVAAMAARLVGAAQESAKKTPRKARKVAKPEPVTA